LITPILFKPHAFRLFAVALALLLTGFSGNGNAAYEFVSSFGSRGAAFGQFDGPRGVAVNSRGKIVITESINNRVQLCDDLGKCRGWGNFGVLSGEFDRPRGVAVNSVDRLFIADRGNDRIESCSSTGSCTDFGGSGTAVGKFESPRGVAIDSQDKIYITDTDQNRIQICNQQGICSAFGSFGSALGQFNSPAGIGIDSMGRIIIADRGNGRIQICTTTGSCSAFGSFGSAPGQFNGPAGIAIDSQDRIIIVDRFNDRIQVCTQQGSCTVFGSFGSGPGQFNAPWGVAVDSQDRIIVADLGNSRIQIFAEPASIPINTGLNDAWYYPGTDGQGFFINVLPTLGVVLVSWFTYDTVRPADGTPSNLGEPGHRWLLAVGPYSGNQAAMDIEIASGGIFDTATPITRTADGTMTLTFSDCNTGTIEYDIPSIGRQGIVPIERVARDNIPLCEALVSGQPAVQGAPQLDSAPGANPAPQVVNGLAINTGLNDAWYYPGTDGQGFFINVLPTLGVVLVSWFTYDTVRPADGTPFNLGEPGHRWLLAVGPYSGNQAAMDIEIASGGIFDTATPITRTADGTMTLTFSDCNAATLAYDIPSIGRQGIVPIERVARDNIPLCEALAAQAQAQAGSQ